MDMKFKYKTLNTLNFKDIFINTFLEDVCFSLLASYKLKYFNIKVRKSQIELRYNSSTSYNSSSTVSCSYAGFIKGQNED